MGVSIYATNSSIILDMGYLGFHKLRSSIAYCLDEEFGKEYEENNGFSKNYEFDDKYKNIIDFLFMSDCSGKISNQTCVEIFKLIKENEERFRYKKFQYEVISKNDYELFCKFLLECYSCRRKMRWS